jgi:uncharacterized membrane protein
VKALRNVGGGLLLVALLVLVWSGLHSPTGRSVTDPLRQAFVNAWHAIRAALPSVHVGTHAGAAIVIALAVFAALVIFVPRTRAGTGMVAAAAAATALGFLLYTTGRV